VYEPKSFVLQPRFTQGSRQGFSVVPPKGRTAFRSRQASRAAPLPSASRSPVADL